MTRIRPVGAALLRFVGAAAIVLAAAAVASAQTQVISARTPSRGGTGGGTTVEVIGNGWFIQGSTTVSMTGGATQPTNVTVHSNTRLTFVTPPRAASPTPYTITVTTFSISRTATFFYVARTKSGVLGARKPVFNYTGQYMAFESRYGVVPSDTNGLVDIYVRTKATGAVRRVSIASSGAQGLGGESTSPAISADGRFIAFQSRATNLVAGDTNGLMDVFVHDRDMDGDGIFDEAGAVRTERVNIGLVCGTFCAPAQAVGGDSGDPAISGNGRYVAFTSSATNMIGSDTLGKSDVFVHDRLRGVTRLISANFNNLPADDHSRDAAMSLNGRFVVFESLADDIAGGNPGTPTVPITDIFLRDRDTDEDGVFDEPGAVDTRLVSSNPCEQNLTNHSIDPSITYDGRYVVFATVASNAKVNQSCVPDDFNGARDIFIWDRFIGSVTRRLSEGSSGELPGASGAPVLSGNGNLLLFRTQAQNAGGGSSPGAIVAAVGEDPGKNSTGEVPSPTTDTPPPADIPPPPPSGSTEDPSTSGDGNTTGSTTEPDPGTGGGEPAVDVDETPEDADGTPFIAGLSPSSGPTAGGAIVEIQGANFVNGQTTIQWNGANFGGASFTFVNGTRLRFTVPAGPGDGPVPVRVISAGESSNEVEYSYSAGLTAPSITSFNPATGPVSGGTVVTITGTGFANPSVRFGPGTGNVTASNATSITVTTPATSGAGPVPVVVQNNNGTTAVSGSPFTYTFVPVTSAPSIQPLTPDHGPVTGGTAITITGTQFAPGATVTVGGVAATDVQVLSNTQIVAVTPAGAQGAQQVVVTVNGSASPAQTFTYDPLEAAVLTCTGTDGDGDGAPNLWETRYGLNPADGTDGALDLDSDGLTNTQECTALTHPRGMYHAVPRRGCDRVVLRHAGRDRQPGCDTRARAVPVPEGLRRRGAPLHRAAGARATHDRRAAAPGARHGAACPRCWNRMSRSWSIGRCGGTGRRVSGPRRDRARRRPRWSGTSPRAPRPASSRSSTCCRIRARPRPRRCRSGICCRPAGPSISSSTWRPTRGSRCPWTISLGSRRPTCRRSSPA